MALELPLQPRPDRIRVLRIIARMNLGGPAHHVSLLSGRLDPSRYQTLLVTGDVGPGEESAEHLARRNGAILLKEPSLTPLIDPPADARALRQLGAIMRAFRPHVVHTHTAKAGLIGRLAALMAQTERPVIVHTFHGHVLRGYFGIAQTGVYRALERALAARSDCLIGVSQATVDELVELKVADVAKFVVVPLGLELDPFLGADAQAGLAVRAEAGVDGDGVLVGLVGRLVPIKQPRTALVAVALARATGTPVRMAIVGDGELRAECEQIAADFQIQDAVTFLGYRRDMVSVASACDIAMLSSANEGTPVWLIEAAAAGKPLLATDVGGVADVVQAGCGFVVAPDDAAALAESLRLLMDPGLRARLGATAREHVARHYSVERLLENIDGLYQRLLAQRAAA